MVARKLELGVEKLKGNKIPKNVISLEKFFYKHDAYIRRERGRKGGTSRDFEGMNIGTKVKPKMINIGSSCSSKEITKAKAFLFDYQDVFSWGYKDLKTYKNGDFKHTVPLKPDAVPFR